MQRSNRVGDEIRRIIANLISNGIKDPRMPEMVSVLEAKVSRDLSHANIYISVLGTDQDKKNCSAALESAAGFLRKELAAKMRLRVVPELHFIIDDSIEQGMRMSKLIDQTVKGEQADD